MEWISRYLNNIPNENITLCRCGENKAEIIENKYSIKIDKDCFLVDDYTKNLIEWGKYGRNWNKKNNNSSRQQSQVMERFSNKQINKSWFGNSIN